MRVWISAYSVCLAFMRPWVRSQHHKTDVGQDNSEVNLVQRAWYFIKVCLNPKFLSWYLGIFFNIPGSLDILTLNVSSCIQFYFLSWVLKLMGRGGGGNRQTDMHTQLSAISLA